MNILITGGTGFIGTRLVKRLADSGHYLLLTTRYPHASSKSELSFPGKLIKWHASQEEFPHHELPSNLDGVINLMGENIAHKRWTSKQKNKLRQGRIWGTQQLIEGLKKASCTPSFFLSASAIGFYPANGEEEIDEHSPKGRGFLSDLCYEWEGALTLLPPGMRKAIMRIGVVLGPEGGALSKLLFPFKLGLGGPVGLGRQKMSWIHCEDLVKGIQTIAENSSYEGVFNLVSPHPVTNKEFTQTLGKVLKRPTLFPIPPLILRLGMGEMSCIVLDGQTILPKALMEKGFQFDYPRIDSALTNLLTG